MQYDKAVLMGSFFIWAPFPPSAPAFLRRCALQKELRSSRGAVPGVKHYVQNSTKTALLLAKFLTLAFNY